MADAGEAAGVSAAGMAELSERAGEGPVVMLNLLRFKPGGEERYAEYGAAVLPLLAEAGGRIVWSGNGGAPVIGEGHWDLVVLVEYPTRQAFIEMTSSPEFVAAAQLRTAALEASELHPLDPAELVVG